MTFTMFLQRHKYQIDAYVKKLIPEQPEYVMTNKERREWVRCDQHLHRWAKLEGVRI